MTDELLKKWKLIACDWQDVNSDLEAENERLKKELNCRGDALVLKRVEYNTLKVGDVVLWHTATHGVWDVADVLEKDPDKTNNVTTDSVFYKLPAPGAK